MRRCWHAPVVYLWTLVFAACSFPDVTVVDDPECLDDSECDGGLRCSAEATCVPCVESSHCPPGMVCAPDATCVECVESSDCGEPEPLCDTASSRCVECLDQGDCVVMGETCVDGTCAPEHCNNLVQDEDEIAEDCGGADCAGCDLETPCMSADDCKSGVCADEQCSLPCTITANCVDLGGTYCDGEVCRKEKLLGEGCALDEECQSTRCVDEVCCETACDQPCHACNIGARSGTCTLRPAGVPDEGCTPGCCDASGACSVVACVGG